MGYANLLIVLMFGCFLACEAGTPCPKRGDLYPCMCTEIPISKGQIYTVVTCRHVPNTRSLASIFSNLRSMRIDKFILYDSFWEAENFDGKQKDLERQLPQNFLTLLLIREVEIHDSVLSACFACDITAGCPNKFLHALSIYNSSSANNICSTCNGRKVWTGCNTDLKHFKFVGNKLESVEKELFAIRMNQMISLNLSYNGISKVGADAFKMLPRLTTLDLSHNKIADLSEDIFGKSETAITFLDLSHNLLKTLSSNIFKYTPHMLTLSAATNSLTKVPYQDWKHLSKKIRTVDLSGNPLICDCHMIWLNCTTKSHVQFLGYCSNEGFDQTSLRRVSRYVSERCVDGELKDQRRNKTLPNGCHEFLLKEKITVQLLELNRVAPNRRDRKPIEKPKSS